MSHFKHFSAASFILVASFFFASNTVLAFDEGHHLTEEEVKVVKRVPPVYPVIAKQMNISGKVVVDLTVNPDGTVDKAQTISGNAVLASAALNAGKGWKFDSVKAEADGSKPIVRVTFNFAMR